MNTKSTIRAFIAIELSDEVKKGLGNLQTRLKSSNCELVKWVDPNSIHLTLKFLGETSLNSIPSIISIMEDLAQNFPLLNISVTELGAFPDPHRVQVIWVGLAGDLNILIRLQKRVETGLSTLGFPTEKRVFVPHLTLARVRDISSLQERQKLGALIKGTSIDTSLKFTADSLKLIQSQLTPSGAIYTNLHSAKLNPSLIHS
jgi:RNA 2',3'-cyclic 3'-phosphodiesterase